MARLKEIPITLYRGRYRVDWRDANGVRHRPSFSTMAEAQAKRDALLNAPARAPVEKPLAIEAKSIKDSIKQYRKVVSAIRVGLTATNEKYYFEELWLFLRNEIKIQFVHEIQTVHLELFRSEQVERGLVASTIKRKENCYRAWLNKCVTWGSIAKSPMDKLKPLVENTPNIKTWSEEQIENAMKQVPAWTKRVLFFLERTGRRPIDAARARFGDVDEVKKTIRVISYKGGKTREIFVPLTDDCLEMIVNIRLEAKRKFRGKGSDYIFLNQKNRPVTTNAIGLVLRKAGIKEVSAYGLRHTFANSLVDDGVHARDVQLLMGHAKFETTTRYTHRDTGQLRAASERRAQKRSLKACV